jgi:hypothetical protein
MKWGKRLLGLSRAGNRGIKKAKQFKKAAIERSIEGNKMYRDQIIHPVSSIKGQGKLIKKYGIRALLPTNAMLKELNSDVAKAVGKDKAKKSLSKIGKTKLKDLQKEYGKLEDKMTYGKKTDQKKNKETMKKMTELEKKMKK